MKLVFWETDNRKTWELIGNNVLLNPNFFHCLVECRRLALIYLANLIKESVFVFFHTLMIK